MNRKSRLGLIKVVNAEEKPKKDKTIEYQDVVKARELEIADGIKLVFSVSKTSEGNPHLDIRTWIESEKYTGPTKKGINFDIESLEEFRGILKEIDSELEKKGI